MKAGNDSNAKIIKKARDEIERKTGKSPEQFFLEREKRVNDAIQLKVPDRVPVIMHGGYFPIRYAGVSSSVAYYEPIKFKEAIIRTLLDFEPDLYCMAGNMTSSGTAMEILDNKQRRWPGGNLPSNYTHQWVEMENMKGDEYDLFMTDPTDFIIRYYFPRVYGTMKNLSELPPLGQRLGGTSSEFVRMSPIFAKPELIDIARNLLKAGQEQAKFSLWSDWEKEIGQLGFLLLYHAGGVGPAPFDTFADYLRGMRGVMIDMHKQPEKLLAACERVLEWRLARVATQNTDNQLYPKRVSGGPFHYSSEAFLSKQQFETFVWPTWKKALLKNIELGLVNVTFGEGKIDDRLEYFLELPKAKMLLRLEQTDIVRAKEILRGHTCIAGNVPGALLKFGSPEEVEEHCKNLIRICGKDGGFILNSSCDLDESKPANVKAMIDSAKKYSA